MTVCALMLIENVVLLHAVLLSPRPMNHPPIGTKHSRVGSWPYTRGCSDISPREIFWPQKSVYLVKDQVQDWKACENQIEGQQRNVTSQLNETRMSENVSEWRQSSLHSCCSSDFILLIQLAVKFVSLCGFCWLKTLKTHLQQWLWALVILALSSFTPNGPPTRLVNDLCPFRASLKL